MKIYFDTCTLQRPGDDRSQLRVSLEAEALLMLLSFCEQGKAILVVSDIIVFETNNNPNPQRQAFVNEIIKEATEYIDLSEEIEQRAKDIERSGIKAIDALHLASAEVHGVDYFCTCDDRFYRRAVLLLGMIVKVCTPLELAQELIT